MKIMISPAKKMVSSESLSPRSTPVFLERTNVLLEYLRSLSYEDMKTLLDCNDQLARLNYERFQKMDLAADTSPALLSYSGIQYQYMAPQVFEASYYEYAEKHLRIISGFYGLLRPFDGVVPYRLEMQARLKTGFCSSLYDFWGSSLYEELAKDSDIILNLASDEYAKAVLKYITGDVRIIKCIFGTLKDGRIIEKGVHVKMARGEMVRYMAENNIDTLDGVRSFDRLGYSYSCDASSDEELVFLS